MPCEHYKDALIEAAATGAGPQGQLRAHLAACSSCRAAFAEEQCLFVSIDAGLDATANAEVPPSLLPRVRAHLEELPVAPRLQFLQPLGFASVTVVLALLIFLIAWPHRPAPVDEAKQIPIIPASAKPLPDIHKENSSSASQIASARANPSHAGRHSTFLHATASSNPEVLIPPDERVAFARFLRRKLPDASVTAALAPKPPLVSVEIFPVEIAALKVEPLNGDSNQQAEF